MRQILELLTERRLASSDLEPRPQTQVDEGSSPAQGWNGDPSQDSTEIWHETSYDPTECLIPPPHPEPFQSERYTAPMTSPKRLSSADNPRVKALVKLRQQRHRRRTGLFIAEGTRELSRALAGGLSVRDVFVCPELWTGDEDPIRSIPGLGNAANISSLLELTPMLFRKAAYRQHPEGILAVFKQPQWCLEELSLAGNGLFLVAVGISKPGNLGAMVRSAVAAGATAMLSTDTVVDAFNPNAIRASTGAVFTFPVIGATTERIQQYLAQRKVNVIMADPNADRPYTDVDLTGPVALVIGAEDLGLGDRWRGAARGVNVTIPMLGQAVDSLNASIASAVLLFEAVRQRRK